MPTTTQFRAPVGGVEKLQMALLRGQRLAMVGQLCRTLLKLLWGISIPPETYREIPYIAHGGPIVVHEKARLGLGVVLFHGVTIGRGDIWRTPHDDFTGFDIGDGVVLCAGATVLATEGTLVVGAGTVVGANAVLTRSTGAGEIWAGIPAKRIGRTDEHAP